jgi:hypothetical protein
MSPIIRDWLLNVSNHCVRDEINNRPDDERKLIMDPDYLKSVILTQDNEKNK